jgi:hypothetical protein
MYEEPNRQQAPTHGPKTPGERFYDITNFAISNICIIAATAAIAYVAAHGKDKYGPVPNYLKKIMQPINRLRGPWAEKAEETAAALKNHMPGITPWDSRKADFKAIFGGSLTGAVILWWGGTVFSPAMKAMEDNREKIANSYNERFASKKDVEQAHENLKDEPKQNWGDILKGRMMAFVFAFTAFSSACFLLGRIKHPTNQGHYPLHFDWYEDKVGRLVAGLSKDGKTIAETPMHIELTDAQKQNSFHRVGKILALDIYATAMAVLVWNLFSRGSAHKRQAAKQAPPPDASLRQATQTAGHAPDPDRPSTSVNQVECHQSSVATSPTLQHTATMAL